MEKFVYYYLLLFFSLFYRNDKDITVLSPSPTRVSKLHIDFTNLLMRQAMSIWRQIIKGDTENIRKLKFVVMI